MTVSTTAEQDFRIFLDLRGKTDLFEKAWRIVRDAAWDDNPEQGLSRNFSPAAIREVIPICTKYRAECEAEWALDNKIEDAIDAAQITFDDEALYEVASYVRVYDSYVEFTALEPGFGPRLPNVKGRKYIGGPDNICWQFPLSALPQLRAIADITFDGEGNKI